jgi:ribosomal protein S27AE
MLDVIPEDPCCGPRLTKAIQAGHKDTRFECPKCGCMLKVQEIREGGIVVWGFEESIEVFHGR